VHFITDSKYMLMIVSAFKLIAEIALLALAGQWLLGVLAGQGRDKNLFYQLFQVLTRPFIRGARLITPKVVIDRHLPLVAFLVLGFVWIAATATKISICVQMGVQQCQ